MAKKHEAKPRRKANLSPELEKETNAILGLLENEEDEHWQIGSHFNRIVDGQLYKADGFKTAHEFAAKLLGTISQATLARYGAIAKAFTEDVAKKYGSTLLESLLTYERLSDATVPTGDPGQVSIKVPNPDGSTTSKHFADCSQDDMRAAVHKLHPPPKPIPSEFRPTIKALEDTLKRFGDETIIVMHVKPTAADAAVSFNLPFNYLEPLRDILVSVFGLPEKALGRSETSSRAKAVIAKGSAWVRGEGHSRASKQASMGTGSIHHGVSQKAKRISRGNGHPRRS